MQDNQFVSVVPFVASDLLDRYSPFLLLFSDMAEIESYEVFKKIYDSIELGKRYRITIEEIPL